MGEEFDTVKKIGVKDYRPRESTSLLENMTFASIGP